MTFYIILWITVKVAFYVFNEIYGMKLALLLYKLKISLCKMCEVNNAASEEATNLSKESLPNSVSTVKPMNSRHLWVLQNLSVIESCALLEGNLKKIVTSRTKCFVRYSWHVRYLGYLLLGGFAVILREFKQIN